MTSVMCEQIEYDSDWRIEKCMKMLAVHAFNACLLSDAGFYASPDYIPDPLELATTTSGGFGTICVSAFDLIEFSPLWLSSESSARYVKGIGELEWKLGITFYSPSDTRAAANYRVQELDKIFIYNMDSVRAVEEIGLRIISSTDSMGWELVNGTPILNAWKWMCEDMEFVHDGLDVGTMAYAAAIAGNIALVADMRKFRIEFFDGSYVEARR